jgi:hypothetical protein
MTRQTKRPLALAEEPPDAASAAASEALEPVGDFQIEMRREQRGGTLVLTPPSGQALQINIDGDRLSLRYSGPRIEISAPDAAIEFAARSIDLRAEDCVTVHGGKEVDIHSGVDVEVRADHHVNLWGHNVLIGD